MVNVSFAVASTSLLTECGDSEEDSEVGWLLLFLCKINRECAMLIGTGILLLYLIFSSAKNSCYVH